MSVTLNANQFFDKAMQLRSQIIQALDSKAQEIARMNLTPEQIDREAFKLEFAGYQEFKSKLEKESKQTSFQGLAEMIIQSSSAYFYSPNKLDGHIKTILRRE